MAVVKGQPFVLPPLPSGWRRTVSIKTEPVRLHGDGFAFHRHTILVTDEEMAGAIPPEDEPPPEPNVIVNGDQP